jgi:uncharacterized protein (TIGR01777 family)
MHLLRHTALPVPPTELFAWHMRTGAFSRLTPPWQTVRVVSAQPVANGSLTKLALKQGPFTLQWHALHSNVIPEREFTDTQAKGPFKSWKHTHRFLPGPTPQASTLEDDITFTFPVYVPPFARRTIEQDIERSFAFRHARTLADLTRHAQFSSARAARNESPTLRAAISGSTGLIGSALTEFLTTGGHDVTRLVRRKPEHPGEASYTDLPDKLDAVIHLAGEPLAKGRWNKRKREAILTSRVETTRTLAKSLAQLRHPPATLIVASGAHFYGHRDDQNLSEDDGIGSGFVPEVVRDWEAAAEPARNAGIRVVHLRIGMVISANGGALRELLPPFRLGLGPILGKGTQWWSWISLDDVLYAILHTLATPSLQGPINLTSPHPVTAAEFSRTLAHAVDRPLFAHVPTPALNLMLGEKAEVLTMSTRVIPAKLRKNNYRFEHLTLESALHHELGCS